MRTLLWYSIFEEVCVRDGMEIASACVGLMVGAYLDGLQYCTRILAWCFQDNLGGYIYFQNVGLNIIEATDTIGGQKLAVAEATTS